MLQQVEGCGHKEALVFNSAQSTKPAVFWEEESKHGFVICGTMGISQCVTTKKKIIIIWVCALSTVTICSVQRAMTFLISQQGCSGRPPAYLPAYLRV